MTTLLLYTLFFAFAFGAAIGSFLNVVIYRVPERLSLVSPPSRCPHCETRIKFYDNIPILSWFLLRGRCRQCGVRIPFRYAFVEILTGAASAALWHRHFSPILKIAEDPTLIQWEWAVLPWIFQFIFCAFLIVITFVDFDTFEIPHEFTIPAMVIGLAAPWVFEYALSPRHIFVIWPPVTPYTSIIGFFAGGLTVLFIFYAYLAIRGIDGIGFGDVTLMAMVGAWLGWPALPFVFFASSLQGVIAAGATTLLGISFVKDSGEIFRDEEEPDRAEAVAEGDGETLDQQEDTLEDSDQQDEIGSEADPELDYEETGFGAVPFGPFIAVAAAEFLFFGHLLPPELSMLYLYY